MLKSSPWHIKPHQIQQMWIQMSLCSSMYEYGVLLTLENLKSSYSSTFLSLNVTYTRYWRNEEKFLSFAILNVANKDH